MDELHYLVSTEHQWKDEYPGQNFSMTGDVSGLYGDCTYFTGDVSGIIGNCTGLGGCCTGIFGDLDSVVIEDKTNPQFKYKWFGNYVTEAEVN